MRCGVLSQAAHTYRLDIELGRMEFLVHPSMAQEDLLVRVGTCAVEALAV